LLLSLIVLFALAGCGGSTLATIHGQTMGTTYTVKVIAADVDEDSLGQAVDAELERVNGLMSTYRPDSELSRLNKAPVGEWFPVSKDTMDVLRMSGKIYRLSHGSFDVTVGPLVNLWGFGPDPSKREVPPDDAIARAIRRVGFDRLSFRDDAVRKDAEVYIDLSSIAKGYGVDRVAELLETRGLHDYMVEVGGELRAKGVNDRGTPWQIAIETPEAMQRSVYRTISVDDMGMATSGDYRNYFEVDGKRYSHTIDPNTGRPITHNLASVTVLASSCAWADGMATAIDVLGPEKGLALAEAQNLPVHVIIKTKDGF